MQVNAGWKGAVALKQWRSASKLARRAAAIELGVSERMLAYYESGERPVPRVVLLATRALAAGLDDRLDGHDAARERWVVLVRNVLDYGSGVPVVGRMLRSGDRRSLADFLAFVKQGPDPAMALTDPAMFQSLRAAVTSAQLAGLAGYRMNVAASSEDDAVFSPPSETIDNVSRVQDVRHRNN